MGPAEFLEEAVERRQAQVVLEYEDGDPRRLGSLAGLAAARGKDAHGLLELFAEAESGLWRASSEQRAEHDWRRWRAAAIEWCLDMLAAREALTEGKSFEWLAWHPSAAALEQARVLLGFDAG